MPYERADHIHVFSVWAASTASRSSPLCRFTVEQGKNILNNSVVAEVRGDVANLPLPRDFDEQHRLWRQDLMRRAEQFGVINFTHGVAAKMINIYLKSMFMSLESLDNDKVMAIHPPIDRVLLGALHDDRVRINIDYGIPLGFWNQMKNIGWSNFNANQYEQVVSNIRTLVGDRGFWSVEEYWQGHQ